VGAAACVLYDPCHLCRRKKVSEYKQKTGRDLMVSAGSLI